MENASKALIMAGSVLISMIIIGMLVGMFNQIRSLKSTESNVEKVQQVTEFNKQYDVYDRNIYGSELLSLANKIKDYNKRESDLKDYAKIELEVTFVNDFDTTFLRKGTYTSSNLIEKINTIETKIDDIGKKSITFTNTLGSKSSRKIFQLSSMRTKDIEELGTPKEDYKTYVTEYNNYKSLLTQIKAKVFKCDGFEYDKYSGRIIKMKYKI